MSVRGERERFEHKSICKHVNHITSAYKFDTNVIWCAWQISLGVNPDADDYNIVGGWVLLNHFLEAFNWYNSSEIKKLVNAAVANIGIMEFPLPF